MSAVDDDTPLRRPRRPQRHRQPMNRWTVIALLVAYGALLGVLVRVVLELTGLR